MPAGNVGVGDAPERGIFMALEFVANRLADRAVEAVGADNPDRFQRALATLERMQSHPDASILLLETDELDPALDLATKACELVGEDALGLFLGNAEVERNGLSRPSSPTEATLVPPKNRSMPRMARPRRRKVSASPMPASSSSERDFTTIARSRPSGSGRRSTR